MGGDAAPFDLHNIHVRSNGARRTRHRLSVRGLLDGVELGHRIRQPDCDPGRVSHDLAYGVDSSRGLVLAGFAH